MYSKEFKEEVLEDYKKCPFPKFITHKYSIGKETLRGWVKQEGINTYELRAKYSEKEKFVLTKDPKELENKEMYKAVQIVDDEKETKNETIQFEINGYEIKLESRYLKEFIKELKR